MTLSDEQVKRLTIDLLKSPSERDKQRKVGASQIANPCDYCLGLALKVGGESKNAGNRWWLGARIGTAIHGALEAEEEKHIDRPMSYHYDALEGAQIEERIHLGVIEGYGVIGSKPDLVLTKHNHLIDHKTSTKAKIARYKLDGVPVAYIVQTQLYAWGLNKSGVTIERISLNFIARDGTQDSDIWVTSFNYDPEIAERAWYRLEKIYSYVQDNEVNTLQSHEDCFDCSINGRV